MANGIISAIRNEFDEKRKNAQSSAFEYKKRVYAENPEIYEIESEISDKATEYMKRMISGEDVKAEMQDILNKLSKKKKSLLKKKGINEKDFEPKYDCEKCNDTGYADGEMCACFKNRVIEENFRNSNIGETLKEQSFNNFSFDYYSDEKLKEYPLSPKENMRRNYDACLEFADSFAVQNKNLLFIGGTGLGKTFLSTCIAKEVLKKGNSAIYISAVDFFKRIEKSRFDSEDTDVKMFETCDLLIIDDLGTEPPSVYATAVFSDILDKRIRSNKKMIFSSNNRFTDFEKMYGERVFSRLAGNFKCLLFYGKDIRIQKFLSKE